MTELCKFITSYLIEWTSKEEVQYNNVYVLMCGKKGRLELYIHVHNAGVIYTARYVHPHRPCMASCQVHYCSMELTNVVQECLVQQRYRTHHGMTHPMIYCSVMAMHILPDIMGVFPKIARLIYT